MTGYCVSDIAAITGGVLSGDGSAPVTGVVIDSRAVTSGALFAAIPGERVDGHDYIGKAFDLGAVCCLAQRVPAGETRPVICVPDTAAALEALARAYRARFAIPVLGVTGSVGKTTAKEMVASVLSQRWNTLKTEKNFNNQLGVPLTLFRLEPEHAAAVVEMGVSHFGDMAPLAAMVQPTAMLFTIIGHAHLEFLRDRRGVLQEKTSVLDTMPDDAVAFCNGDDDLLRAMTCRQRKVTFGLSAGCDVRAVDVRDLGDEGSTCTIVAGTRRIPVRISAYGQHMAYAALEGAAVGIEYGLTDDEIIRGIARLTNDDVAHARKRSDGICRCPWPIELHAGKTPYLFWLINDYYEVPYGSLVPETGEHLLVAGRNLCAEHQALASCRVTAQCFEYGHAAALAADLSIRRDLPLRELSGAEIRARMNENGARLD